jgi:NAD(P)-dependent dehydrogenase (short-subunit alcohol dehydrogenase family)
MTELLANKVAVVTGAASGNGRAIALAFARHGAKAVIVADVQAEPREGGQPTHELITAETQTRATFVKCNVTNIADLEAAVEAAEAFGGIDVMVNNAGVFRQQDFLTVTEAEYAFIIDINVKGVYFGAQAAAKRMVARGRGSIINLSSVAGLQGTAGFVTYCTSKGAVRLMTYALADELGPRGIRVNALHPGLIETTMTTKDVPVIGSEMGTAIGQTIPLRRFGQPGDVADAAVYLASDLASYVNGASLVIDGGLLRA